MSDEETFHSSEESLRLIADVISRTKENLKENSFPFLLWGWLIAIASFFFFFLHQFTSFRLYFLPFPILAIVGVITTTLYYRKKNSTSTITYLGSFLSKMWLALGVSFFIAVFINVSQNKVPFTYTLLVAGIGTLASGLVMKFRPMIAGGLVFFVSVIISIYIPDNYKVLLQGFTVILGFIIPGYMLKSQKV